MHSQKVTNLDIIGHFWKSTKTLFSKAYNFNMEYQNEMRPKGLVIRHLKLSKKSRNTSKSSKLKKLCVVPQNLPSHISQNEMIKMRWYKKGWLEDISIFLKSPRTPPKAQNGRSYALLKLDLFAKLPKVNYPQNFKFCQKGQLHQCITSSILTL